MSNTIGILRSQLHMLETAATNLERIAYSELTALETLTADRAAQHEERVLRKLQELDEVQEEIDVIVGKLKDLGAYYSPANPSALIYEYKVPKRVVTYQDRQGIPTKTAWQSFSEQLPEDGRFTFNDLMSILNIKTANARQKLKHWRKQGYLETVEKDGLTAIYQRISLAERHSQ